MEGAEQRRDAFDSACIGVSLKDHAYISTYVTDLALCRLFEMHAIKPKLSYMAVRCCVADADGDATMRFVDQRVDDDLVVEPGCVKTILLNKSVGAGLMDESNHDDY